MSVVDCPNHLVLLDVLLTPILITPFLYHLQEWEEKAAKAKEDYGKMVKEFEANGGSATGESKKRSKTSKKPAKKSKKKDSEDDESDDDGSD